MLLNEILNKKVEYEVIRANDKVFRARATIGGRIIQFEAAKQDTESSDKWDVAFEENKEGKRTFGKSGSGNEFEVFSMIKDCILEVIARYKPEYMTFTADKDGSKIGNNRGNVYSRLLSRFKVSGYTIERTELEGHDEFLLSRNN
jgi:hypothetical protein